MIQAKVRNNIKFPKIILQEQLEEIAKDIIIPDIQNRIRQHKAIDGGLLPDNEDSTKNRKGHGNQLRDTDTLLNSFVYRSVGKDRVKINIGSERHDIGGYLQSTGIKTNMGYKAYKFFGISIFANRKAIDYMKKKIEERTRPNYAGESI